MKKVIIVLVIVVLLVLDWLALDDLTTGNEPDKRGEAAMIVGSVPLLFVFGKELLKPHKRDRR